MHTIVSPRAEYISFGMPQSAGKISYMLAFSEISVPSFMRITRQLIYLFICLCIVFQNPCTGICPMDIGTVKE